jgi:2-iminoacetate synthase
MSVKSIVDEWLAFDFYGYLERVTVVDVERSLAKDKLSPFDFLNLLSPAASGSLERMAAKAHETTVKRLRKTMQSSPALYRERRSNSCAYCGFSAEKGSPAGP